MICPNCHKKYTPFLGTRQNPKQLIQNEFPNATPIQREQLLTGICSDQCMAEYISSCNQELLIKETTMNEIPCTDIMLMYTCPECNSLTYQWLINLFDIGIPQCLKCNINMKPHDNVQIAPLTMKEQP